MNYAPSVSTITQAPSEISHYEQVGSARMMKKVLPLAIATLVYRRCKIDGSCFNSRTANNVQYFGFSNSKINESNPISNILHGVNVIPILIEKQCLLSLILIIDVKSPQNTTEVYKFTIVYEENENGCDPRAKGLMQAALNFFTHINRLELSEKYLQENIELMTNFGLVSDPKLSQKLLQQFRPSTNTRILQAINTVASFNTQYHNIIIATNINTNQQDVMPRSTENIIIDLSADDGEEGASTSLTKESLPIQKDKVFRNQLVPILSQQIKLADETPQTQEDGKDSQKGLKKPISQKRKLKDASRKQSKQATLKKRNIEVLKTPSIEMSLGEQSNDFIPSEQPYKPILNSEELDVIPKKQLIEKVPKTSKKIKISKGLLNDRVALYTPSVTDTNNFMPYQETPKARRAQTKQTTSKSQTRAIKAISNAIAANQTNAKKSKAMADANEKQIIIDSEKFNSDVVNDNEFSKQTKKNMFMCDSDSESFPLSKFARSSSFNSGSLLSLSDEEFCINVSTIADGKTVKKK